MTQLQSWRQIPDRVSTKPFEFEVIAEALTEAARCRSSREVLRKTTS
jgi:hypothetical protein